VRTRVARRHPPVVTTTWTAAPAAASVTVGVRRASTVPPLHGAVTDVSRAATASTASPTTTRLRVSMTGHHRPRGADGPPDGSQPPDVLPERRTGPQI